MFCSFGGSRKNLKQLTQRTFLCLGASSGLAAVVNLLVVLQSMRSIGNSVVVDKHGFTHASCHCNSIRMSLDSA